MSNKDIQTTAASIAAFLSGVDMRCTLVPSSSLPRLCMGASLLLWTLADAAPAPFPYDLATKAFVQRCGTQLCTYNPVTHANDTFRLAGANAYWLGLDENVPPGTIAYPTQFRIWDALTTAATYMGATVVRGHTLGISVGNPLSFEPALGVFNATALLSADYAIAVAGQLGLRLQIPLIDNYHYYHGGKHCFTDWLGLPEADFYTNATVIAAFKAYIYQRLTHVNAYNGLAAKDDPTIMVWETGNELQAPSDWTATISAYIKEVAPNQLVMDGNYGINTDSLNISTVDVFSDHFYPVDNSRLAADVALTSAAGKAFVVGEFGWNSGDVTGFLQAIQASPYVAYDAFWSLFPHLDTYGWEEHNDGFTIHYPGDNSGMVAIVEALAAHAYAMSNTSVPVNSLPQAPLITSISLSANTVAWRGGAGAANYSIEVANAPSGPFTVVCTWCVTDNGTPYLLPSRLQQGQYVRVRGMAPSGVIGPYSPVNTSTVVNTW